MPKRTRPGDSEYYVPGRTEHVAQGDIFDSLPFFMALPQPPPEDLAGVGKRRLPGLPWELQVPGIVLSHTSGFMAQPPATRGVLTSVSSRRPDPAFRGRGPRGRLLR